MKGDNSSISGVVLLSAVSLVIGCAVFMQQQTTEGFKTLLPLTPAANKPFSTFDEFYPIYLQEHSLPNTRRLHFVGTTLMYAAGLVMPSTLLALLTGMAVGSTLFPFTRSVPHGLLEGVGMILAFVSVARSLNGSWSKTIFLLGMPYAFAWVGHFFIEHNRPATFIYPTYSLMGDLRMHFAMLTGEIPF